MTRLYIVGCEPRDLPEMPMTLGRATHVIASSTARQRRGHPDFRPEVTKSEREKTPPELAKWLVELARRCGTVATDIRPCEFCGYSFDHDKLGRYGCPNCEGEPIDANDEEVAA